MITHEFEFWSDILEGNIFVTATVTDFTDVDGEYSFNSASDTDYYGYTDIDWEYEDLYLVDEDGKKVYLNDNDLSKSDLDYIREKLIELQREYSEY